MTTIQDPTSGIAMSHDLDEAKEDYIADQIAFYRGRLLKPGGPNEIQQEINRFFRECEYQPTGNVTDIPILQETMRYELIEARLAAVEARLRASSYVPRPEVEDPLGAALAAQAAAAVDTEALERVGRDKVLRTMHSKGLSFGDIAAYTGLSKSAVAKICKASSPRKTRVH